MPASSLSFIIVASVLTTMTVLFLANGNTTVGSIMAGSTASVVIGAIFAARRA